MATRLAGVIEVPAVPSVELNPVLVVVPVKGGFTSAFDEMLARLLKRLHAHLSGMTGRVPATLREPIEVQFVDRIPVHVVVVIG